MNRIDYLLQRYLRREETEQERIELMELISSGKYRDQVEDQFANALLNRMPEAGAWVDDFTRHHLQEVRDRLNLASEREEKNTVRARAERWFRAAAAVLVLGICFMTWRYTTRAVQRTDAVAIVQSSSVKASDGITKVILDDGTLVWLKGSSTITYPGAFTGKSRNVVLEGEALFEVAKDPFRPFIIQCGDLKTTVLGTSFNIKTIEEDIEVMVLTGKVALSSTGNEGRLELLPNEKALYKTSEKQLARVEHVAAEKERMAVLEGTEYNMTFDDARMVEIIERVESKFNVMVKFSDHELANCRMTADFSDQSLEHTLVLIAQALGIGYEIHGTEIRLVGAGCDDKVSSN